MSDVELISEVTFELFSLLRSTPHVIVANVCDQGSDGL